MPYTGLRLTFRMILRVCPSMTQGQALFYKLDDGVEASFIADDEILVRSSDKTVLGVNGESGNVVAVIRVKDPRVGVDVEAYIRNDFSIIRDKGPRPWPDWLATTRWRRQYTK